MAKSFAVNFSSNLLFALFITILVLSACQSISSERKSSEEIEREYVKWRNARERRLRSQKGYLALAGIYWLQEGENTFGSDPGNDFVFPEGKAPAKAGVFRFANGEVTVEAASGVPLLHGKEIIQSIKMVSDAKGKPTRVQIRDLTFWVIKREEMIGIRLRDPESPILKNYRGTERFPFSPAWRLKGKFEPFEALRILQIPNILGTISKYQSPGYLTFQYKGKDYRLDIVEKTKSGFSLEFGDQTNGNETYGGGRSLTIPFPKEGSRNTIIDFNRAYNPPCAYSPYTTCSLPPRQNLLPFRVKAGEKSYEK